MHAAAPDADARAPLALPQPQEADLLTARASTSTPPPPLHPHLRENLVRGLRATIRREEARCQPLVIAGRGIFALRARIEALRADLRELEAL